MKYLNVILALEVVVIVLVAVIYRYYPAYFNYYVVALLILSTLVTGYYLNQSIIEGQKESIVDFPQDLEDLEDLEEVTVPLVKAMEDTPIHPDIVEQTEMHPQSAFGSFNTHKVDPEAPMADKYHLHHTDSIHTKERGHYNQKPHYRYKSPVCKINGVEVHQGVHQKLTIRPGSPVAGKIEAAG